MKMVMELNDVMGVIGSMGYVSKYIPSSNIRYEDDMIEISGLPIQVTIDQSGMFDVIRETPNGCFECYPATSNLKTFKSSLRLAISKLK
jgi:hypothetical protein